MVTVLVFPGATAALVREALPRGARVVAVDAGAEALEAAGVRPDLVVGDMDSVTGETLARLERQGVPLVRHPPEKRDTDGMLALREARDDEVVLLGPGGGRADHALANLHLLLAASRRMRASAVDEDARTWAVTPAHPLELRLPEGTTLSVLPFSERAEGVTLEGLRYALREADMDAGDPYGMSNVCLAPPQRVSVRKGTLLAIEPRGFERGF